MKMNKKDILLFYGLIKKIYIFQEAGMSQIIIVAVSGSQQMDREKKSRSFQNINLTYEQIVQSILADYKRLPHNISYLYLPHIPFFQELFSVLHLSFQTIHVPGIKRRGDENRGRKSLYWFRY